MQQNTKYWKRDFILLTFLIGILFFSFLNVTPISIPDSARYAEMGREMAVSGDYVTPRLNGVKYFEKPVLFIWFEAAMIKASSTSVRALHFPTALLALLGCLMTYAATRQLFGRAAGLWASLILATSSLYVVMEHIIALDLPLTLFVSASLFAFLLAMREPPGRARMLWMWGAFSSAALAVLTKGLVGIIFPCMIIGAWISFLREWRLLKSLSLVSGTVLFLVIALPWHILVQLKNPEFFNYYIIYQQFLRYATTSACRYQPNWFYIPMLAIGFFPWIVFLVQAIRFNLKLTEHRKEIIFLLIWVGFIFVFFSFSKSKLIPYILPIFPPLAVLLGRYFSMPNEKGVKIGMGVLVVLALAMSTYFCFFTEHYQAPHPVMANRFLYAASLILSVGAIAAFIASFRHQTGALKILIGTSILFFLTLLNSASYLDSRTVKPLTSKIQLLWHPGDEVVSYKKYYQELPLYMQQRVTMVGDFDELLFGSRFENTQAWIISSSEFSHRWKSHKRLFVVTDWQDYLDYKKAFPKRKIVLLAETEDNVLITNHNLKTCLNVGWAKRSVPTISKPTFVI